MDFELHYKAKKWHEDFLRWAKNNGATDTDEYKVTKYALECIEFKRKYEPFIRARYKEEGPI